MLTGAAVSTLLGVGAKPHLPGRERPGARNPRIHPSEYLAGRQPVDLAQPQYPAGDHDRARHTGGLNLHRDLVLAPPQDSGGAARTQHSPPVLASWISGFFRAPVRTRVFVQDTAQFARWSNPDFYAPFGMLIGASCRLFARPLTDDLQRRSSPTSRPSCARRHSAHRRHPVTIEDGAGAGSISNSGADVPEA